MVVVGLGEIRWWLVYGGIHAMRALNDIWHFVYVGICSDLRGKELGLVGHKVNSRHCNTSFGIYQGHL